MTADDRLLAAARLLAEQKGIPLSKAVRLAMRADPALAADYAAPPVDPADYGAEDALHQRARALQAARPALTFAAACRQALAEQPEAARCYASGEPFRPMVDGAARMASARDFQALGESHPMIFKARKVASMNVSTRVAHGPAIALTTAGARIAA